MPPKTRSKRKSTPANLELEPKKKKVSTVQINRAPVLTLWVACIAETEGHSFEEGLSYGKWISGVYAQKKGQSLGIYEAKEKTEQEIESRKLRDKKLGVAMVDVFGTHIPTLVKNGRHLAVTDGKCIEPASVLRYLKKSFGEQGFIETKGAMEDAISNVPSQEELGKRAYHLYEQFRPAWKGWGMKGELSLEIIKEVVK